jgi:hypothetical protein
MKKQIPRGLPPLLLLALLLCTWMACKKDPLPPYTGPQPIDYTVLPPATQTGAGTFGCLVDGEVWVPRVPLGTVTYRDISALISEKDGSGGGGITCNLVDIEKQIDNSLSISTGVTNFETMKFCYPDYPIVRLMFRKTNGQWYLSQYFDIDENCLTITRFDTLNNIISGTFSFTAYKDSIDKNDKIKITDGRFDLKYSSQ